MWKDYQEPKRHWSDKQWLKYCLIHMHNPHINEEEREYYREKYYDLSNKNKQ